MDWPRSNLTGCDSEPSKGGIENPANPHLIVSHALDCRKPKLVSEINNDTDLFPCFSLPFSRQQAPYISAADLPGFQ